MDRLYKTLIHEGVSEVVAVAAINAINDCKDIFADIEEIKTLNYLKVLAAFTKNKVNDGDLYGTTGYGYADSGREKLESIYAHVFGCEDSIVRTQFVSGTHAISSVLYALLKAEDSLLFIGGPPYDTLNTIIGHGDSKTKLPGTLSEKGVLYDEVPFTVSGGIDEPLLLEHLKNKPRMCMIQRSRGYSARPSWDISRLSHIIDIINHISPDSIIFIDNCYGEFVELEEPPEVGAHIVAGSLIKNPGGGLAPSGGYVAGKKSLVDIVASRLIAPGIARDCGPTLGTNRDYLRGFYLAPTVAAEAVKGAVFSARLCELLGFNASPSYCEKRSDIVQIFEFDTPNQLVEFCRGVQAAGPVNSSFAPEPAPMPGYEDKIIMASPSFIQGSSIEISCDAPLRPPYHAFYQGGMFFQHSMICAITGFDRVIRGEKQNISEY